MTHYIEPEEAVLAARHLGFAIRDDGLLFSALARPSASAFGADAYESLPMKMAALMTSIAKNHALVDGNKRFAWYLALAFARINGRRVVMSNDDAYSLVMSVAEDRIELHEIAAIFESRMVLTEV